MAVGCGGAVHRVQQVEHARDRIRAQVEVLTHQLDDLAIADLAGAEGVDRYRRRQCHADGVGHLNFTTLGQAGSDDILGDIAPGVGRAAIYFGWILAGEGATAMARHAAVGVDDDLAAGQAAVAHRAPNHEVTGRVDVVLGVGVQQF